MDAIFIPSLGRAKTVHTAKIFQGMGNVGIVVRPWEEAEYRKYNIGMKFLVLPETVKAGIGPTRQYILDISRAKGYTKIGMIDDDMLEIQKSVLNSDGKMVKDINLTENFGSTTHFVNYMSAMLDRFTACGMLHRRDAYLNAKNFPINAICGFYANCFINLETLPKHCRFDRVEFKEDYDFLLNILNSSLEIGATHEYNYQSLESNADGGCSTTRTIERHDNATTEFHNLWPMSTRLRKKQDKISFGGLERLETTIYWKKTYQNSFND